MVKALCLYVTACSAVAVASVSSLPHPCSGTIPEECQEVCRIWQLGRRAVRPWPLYIRGCHTHGLAGAVVTTQDQTSQFQHGQGRERWGSTLGRGANGSWWLLKEAESLSLGAMAAGGLPMSQWVAPHLCTLSELWRLLITKRGHEVGKEAVWEAWGELERGSGGYIWSKYTI